MVPGRFRVDIFEEIEKLLGTKFEGIILSPVLAELESLRISKSAKNTKMVNLALEFAKKLKTVRVKLGQNENVDDVILRFAKKIGCPVATNDKKLKKRLRDIKVPVIYLRQQSRILMEGVIQCR